MRAILTRQEYEDIKRSMQPPNARELMATLRAIGLLDRPALNVRRALYNNRTPVVILGSVNEVLVTVEFLDGIVRDVTYSRLTLIDPPAKMQTSTQSKELSK